MNNFKYRPKWQRLLKTPGDDDDDDAADYTDGGDVDVGDFRGGNDCGGWDDDDDITMAQTVIDI